MISLTIWCALLCVSFSEAFQAAPTIARPPRTRHNTFKHRGIFVSDPQQTEGPPVSLTISDDAPSWDDLRLQLVSTPTGSRLQQEATDREQGLGPPHTDALLRLFPKDNPNVHDEKDVRVTLYRDQAGWCLYCQKVWLFLEQKRIPYKVQKIPLNAYGDKPAWYTRKVEGGKLPAVEVDGILQVESMEIMKLLEETFPNHGPRMIPLPGDSDNNAAKMDELLELEQELQRAWFSLTFYPVKEEALVKANQTFLETLARVDQALGSTESPWFLGGDGPSLVDIQYITLMERIAPSVLYWKGLDIRSLTEIPHFQKWLAAFERLPHYLASRSDYYTHIMAIPSQNGPGYMIPSAKPIANQISGLSGAWNLPLDLDRCLEPFPGNYRHDGEEYSPCHEAAYRVVENHASIAIFACRGAGEPGRPSFHAELADPYAELNEGYLQAVDVSLRHVVNALLQGLPSNEVEAVAKQDLWGKGGSNELRDNWEAHPDDNDSSLTYYWNYETGDATWTPPTQQLDTCLTYLRDRVGVPRDMGPAAAMQLRAHLNWVIALMKG